MKTMTKNTEIISFFVPETMAKDIDKLVYLGYFTSRSEVIRFAIWDLLKKLHSIKYTEEEIQYVEEEMRKKKIYYCERLRNKVNECITMEELANFLKRKRRTVIRILSDCGLLDNFKKIDNNYVNINKMFELEIAVGAFIKRFADSYINGNNKYLFVKRSTIRRILKEHFRISDPKILRKKAAVIYYIIEGKYAVTTIKASHNYTYIVERETLPDADISILKRL